MAMSPLSNQPMCAVVIAQAYVCCGMGVDDANVDGLVNFNSFYTSHYTWSYVFHLFSLWSRSISLVWILAATKDFKYLVLGYLFGFRLLLLYCFDSHAFFRPLVNNLIRAVSLVVSDSAWQKDESRRRETQTRWLALMALTTLENVVGAGYVAFMVDDSAMSYHASSMIFMAVVLMMLVRLVLVFHWLLPVHFPEFYDVHSAEETFTQVMQNNSGKVVLKRREIGVAGTRRNAVGLVSTTAAYDTDTVEAAKATDAIAIESLTSAPPVAAEFESTEKSITVEDPRSSLLDNGDTTRA